MNNNGPVYNILRILPGTTADGPGLRTSIYMAGCSHNCPGCHNPQSHSPQVGTPTSLQDILATVVEEDFDVTLTGGDPLFDPVAIIPLLQAIRSAGYRIWLYTGFTWEEIIRSSQLKSAVSYADVIVDGRYDASLRNTSLLFRGSSNQRLIQVEPSLRSGTIVCYP